MARKKKETETQPIETYKPLSDSDIEIGTKIYVDTVDGVGNLNIVGLVEFIHEKHFAFSYGGANGRNLAVLPLPRKMGKDDYYEIIKE